MFHALVVAYCTASVGHLQDQTAGECGVPYRADFQCKRVLELAAPNENNVMHNREVILSQERTILVTDAKQVQGRSCLQRHLLYKEFLSTYAANGWNLSSVNLTEWWSCLWFCRFFCRQRRQLLHQTSFGWIMTDAVSIVNHDWTYNSRGVLRHAVICIILLRKDCKIQLQPFDVGVKCTSKVSRLVILARDLTCRYISETQARSHFLLLTGISILIDSDYCSVQSNSFQ